MKALRILCLVALFGLLAMGVPVAADEGPGVAQALAGDVIQFIPILGDITSGFEVMNVGGTQTFVDVWYYDSTGAVVARQQNRRINGLSSRTVYPVPVTSAASAVVVSFTAKVNPAHPADWIGDGWPPPPATDTGYTYNWAAPLAATVNRIGSGGKPAGTYTSVGRQLLPWDEADGNPYTGGETYWIFAPVVQKNNNGWNSTIWIQHAYLGNWYGETFNPPLPGVTANVYFYTPGGAQVGFTSVNIPAFASVRMPIPGSLPNGVYSCWIRANGLIAGVADQYNSPALGNNTGIFMAYRISPRNRLDQQRGSANFNFGPLIFSQYNGWDAGIAVLNTSGTQDAYVVINFRDPAGTLLHTMSTTIQEQATQILYPLVNFGLPPNQIGSVSIEAQNYQGVQPDQSIVTVVNQFNPAESKGSAYNALRAIYNAADGSWFGLDTSIAFAVPLLMKYNGGTSPTTGWSTGLVLMHTNVRNPQAEPFQINFYDPAGLFSSIRVNLKGGQTFPYDMRWTTLPAGWVGSAVVWSREWNDPLGVVVNELYDPPQMGDRFMTYEGYPY